MKISTLGPEAAVGHLSVHAIRTASVTVKKGAILSAEDAGHLREAGIEHVICAIADDDDIHEDEACEILAAVLKTAHITATTPATGRVNFTCQMLGVLRYDRQLLKQINMIDEGITLAFVQHNQLLATGDMVATLKIIPFYICRRAVEQVADILQKQALFSFHPLASKQACLIQTRFDHQPVSLFEATEAVTRERLANLGAPLIDTAIIDHNAEALKTALLRASDSDAQLILVTGASAIAHRDDLIPTAITEAGGKIDHFGLAVDPGNLLMLGQLGGKMVIGMPGCARSPKLNGFDWVLQLFFAGLPLDKDELAEMSAGGLLMEIASRPLPRAISSNKPRTPHIEAILLGAGTSSRMGEANKLVTEIAGKPMIRIVAEAICDSAVDGLTVILGHEAETVSAALDGIDARFVFNPDYKSGQASSIRCGLNQLPQAATDMMVCLGDMPFIDSHLINRLVDSHLGLADRWSHITLPFAGGHRGNPVIWGRSFFDEIGNLSGDTGARALFHAYQSAMNIVACDDTDICLDADTSDDLDRIKQIARQRLA